MLNGADIRKKRKSLGLTAGELADLLSVDRANLYKWEKGHKPTDPEDYIKLERWLKGELENVLNNNSLKPSIVTEGGDIAQPTNLYERLIAAEEARRKEVEDRRIRAEKQADEYLQIIKDNLTALLLSSSKSQELLLKIWDEQTSDDLVMMDNQDEAAKNPKGTSAGKADRNLIKLATARKEAQQKSGTGKPVKAGK